MIWYEHLFLGKKCRKNFGRLKHKITNRQAHSGVYLIVLPENDSDRALKAAAIVTKEGFAKSCW